MKKQRKVILKYSSNTQPLSNPVKKNNLLLPIIIVFCVPVLLYIQTVSFGFTKFDDDLIITKNIDFMKHIGNAGQAFLTDAFINRGSSFYRPLQTVSYMMDIQLSGGNNVWMFHLSNILLLGFISCLLFLLLSLFLIPKKLALFGALLYCANPLFVSSVAWIPARGDLMLTMFSLLSFIFFINFLQKQKVIYLFLNWAAFTIALFCKETAALLPVLFISYYFIFSSEKRFKKEYIFLIILYAISGIFWMWLRSKAIGGVSNQKDMVGMIPILLNLRTIPESLIKFFLLFDLAPIPGFSIFKTVAGSVVIVLIIILFIKSKERLQKEKVFCLLWFVLLMMPPLLYKNEYINYLDHRFFLPLMGILLYILFLIPEKWLEKGDIKRVWLPVALLVIFSIFTLIKSNAYSSPSFFYDSAVAHNPNSAFAYYNKGVSKMDRQDYDAASECFNKAIAINPNYAEAYNDRGFIKFNNNDSQGAIVDFNKAIALKPDYAQAYNNRGSALGAIGKYKDAIADFNKAIELNPKDVKAYYNRAFSKCFIKDFAGALSDCDTYLKLKPEDEKVLKLKSKIQQVIRKLSH